MRQDTDFSSSFLVKPSVIAAWLVLCVIAVLFEKTAIGLFLGFVFVLTLISYLWAKNALRKVEYEFKLNQSVFFPGQSFTITRTIRNRKALPIIWSEIREDCDPDDPASPDERLIVYREEAGSDENESFVKIYERLYTVSIVHAYRSVSFEDRWDAKHRGIMKIEASILKAGDGFGLSMIGKRFELPVERRIVVFPKLADVSIGSILNEMWDTRSESGGYLQDHMIIKSIRDYMPGDPAKDINMRLLARGQGMQVNVFETTTPDTILFILDARTFRNSQPELFEQCLSVLAALIDKLTKHGIRVSLLTPASKWFGETCTAPSCGDRERYEMLELLAAASSDDAELSMARLPELAYETGRFYYVCADASKITTWTILNQLPEDKTFLLTAGNIRADGTERIRTRDLFDFERVS